MPTVIKKESGAASGIFGILHATGESRFQHRLHAVMAVSNGLSTKETAELFGDSQRSVLIWISRFNKRGVDGLRDLPREGRPTKLNKEQLDTVLCMIHTPPRDPSLPDNTWNGRILSSYIRMKYSIFLGVRQCERYIERERSIRRRSKR